MNRLALAKRHFDYFRGHKLWLHLWFGVWFLQVLATYAYWSDTEPAALPFFNALALAPALGTVFVFGNLYSARNNPFLRTRPLPASTPFLTDCALPFGLYMIIPLLREIPVVIGWQFGTTDLLWAWLDSLVLYGLAFAAIWLVGAMLPRLRTPLQWAGALMGGLLALWLAAAVTGRALGTLNLLEDFIDSDFPNTAWYGTSVAVLGVVTAFCAAALKFRLSDRARVVFLYCVVPPVVTFCFQRGPDFTSETLTRLDLHRSGRVEEAGYELKCLAYRGEWQRHRHNGVEVVGSAFNVLVRGGPHSTAATGTILRSRAHGRWGKRDLEIDRRGYSRRWAAAMYSLLHRHYGGRPFRSGISSYDDLLENNQRIRFRAHKLEDLRGELLRIDHDMLIREYELTPLMVGKAPQTDFSGAGRRGGLRVKNPVRRLRVLRNLNANRAQISAEFSLRRENLVWKRLLVQPPGDRALGLVFREPDGPGMEVAVEHLPAWEERAGGAFPLTGGYVGESFRYRLTSPSGKPRKPSTQTGDLGRVVVDLFEMRPRRTVRGTATAFSRFWDPGSYSRDERKDFTQMLEHEPLEALRRIGQGRAPRLPGGTMRQLAYGLSRQPGAAYRHPLFQAAKFQPELATFIINNGWEKEAMDVWLDLVRQKRELPLPVLRALFLVGEDRLKEALVEYQRYHPSPAVISASRLRPDWRESIWRATEKGVDLWFRRVAPFSQRGRILRRRFPRVLLSGLWVEHDGILGMARDPEVRPLPDYYPMPYAYEVDDE